MQYLKKLEENIVLKATSGRETIARADDVFIGYIDSDFEKWNLDKKGGKTEETKIAVLEMTQDGTFEQIFGSISNDKDSLCLTQNQIIEFMRSHKDKLNKDWYTFFLFKEGNDFFVAGVRFCGDGLYVRVYRLSRGCVWLAEGGRRVVVPQLALKNSEADTLTPSPSVPLPEILIINGVKYKIIK